MSDEQQKDKPNRVPPQREDDEPKNTSGELSEKKDNGKNSEELSALKKNILKTHSPFKIGNIKPTSKNSTFTEEELLNSKDLPTLLNRLMGIPDDTKPRFGELAGKPPVDENGKPRFFTVEESLERQIKRESQTGHLGMGLSMMDALRHQMIISKWLKKHQQQSNEQGSGQGV